jgi:hypothetical protein
MCVSSGWRVVSVVARAAVLSLALGAVVGGERDAEEAGDAGAGELPGDFVHLMVFRAPAAP